MADHKEQPVIIIRRKKKGRHAGHHGGAWKVAYADFVTAMMSFFLLLWLLNVTTSDQRKGIADYFAPMSISRSEGGSGGVMGGTSISSPNGAEISPTSPIGPDDQTVATVGKGDLGEEDITGKNEKISEEEKQAAYHDKVTQDAVELAEAMKKEEEKFKQAEEVLKQAIAETPGLKEFAENFIIDRTPEGLRIQIIDKDKFSLFPSGSSSPYEKGRDLLRLVGAVVSRLSNKISVTGHTDSSPYSPASRRNNWDLSTDRANVSRGELQIGGVPEARIARVVGLADKDPFIPGDPKDSRNRRISIVLLRQTGMGAVPPQAPPEQKATAPSQAP